MLQRLMVLSNISVLVLATVATKELIRGRWPLPVASAANPANSITSMREWLAAVLLVVFAMAASATVVMAAMQRRLRLAGGALKTAERIVFALAALLSVVVAYYFAR